MQVKRSSTSPITRRKQSNQLYIDRAGQLVPEKNSFNEECKLNDHLFFQYKLRVSATKLNSTDQKI